MSDEIETEEKITTARCDFETFVGAFNRLLQQYATESGTDPQEVPPLQAIIFQHRLWDEFEEMSGESPGVWHYYTTSNGAAYMRPMEEKTYTFDVETNGRKGRLSSDAAGIAATLAMCSQTSFAMLTNGDVPPFARACGMTYHRLRALIYQHPECAKILHVLD